jgi:hypothetical protein
MEQDYEKKDIKESPKTKAPAPKRDFPKGWEYYVKRGRHCLRGPDGMLRKFDSKDEAMKHANG